MEVHQCLLLSELDVPDGTRNGPFDVTITFSADVSDFTEDDITLTGSATATVTDLIVDSVLVEGVWEVYTATITPTTDGDSYHPSAGRCRTR